MSEVFIDRENAFDEHPCASLFIEEAINAHLISPDSRISPQTRRELTGLFGLSDGETAALAYLSEHFVKELDEELDMDLLVLGAGGIK